MQMVTAHLGDHGTGFGRSRTKTILEGRVRGMPRRSKTIIAATRTSKPARSRYALEITPVAHGNDALLNEEHAITQPVWLCKD